MWHVYVDKEIKHGSVETARHLFRRVTHIKFNNKAMQVCWWWCVCADDVGCEGVSGVSGVRGVRGGVLRGVRGGW